MYFDKYLLSKRTGDGENMAMAAIIVAICTAANEEEKKKQEKKS